MSKGDARPLPGRPGRYTLLLLVLVGFIGMQPLLQGRGALVDGALTLFLLASMWASGGKRWRRALRIVLGIAVVLVLWGRNAGDHEVLAISEYLLWTVFHGFICISLLTMVFRSPMVTIDVVSGGVAGYLLLGITWCGLYAGLEKLAPGSFSGIRDSGVESGALLEFVYFSFTTLTTLGYGDILPESGFARSLALLEAIAGVMFTAILISALMSRYLAYAISHPREMEEEIEELSDGEDPSESAGGTGR